MQQLKTRTLERRVETGEAALATLSKQVVTLEETIAANEELRSAIDSMTAKNDVEMFNLTQALAEAKSVRKETQRLAQKFQLTLKNTERETDQLKHQVQQEFEVEIEATRRVGELEQQVKESLKREESYEQRMQEINAKVNEFSGLMDRLIEENERLKTEAEFEARKTLPEMTSETNFFKRTHPRAFINARRTLMDAPF